MGTYNNGNVHPFGIEIKRFPKEVRGN